MDAVRANHADDNRADHADHPAGVMEGVRHRQDAGAQRALEQVDERVHVSVIA